MLSGCVLPLPPSSLCPLWGWLLLILVLCSDLPSEDACPSTQTTVKLVKSPPPACPSVGVFIVHCDCAFICFLVYGLPPQCFCEGTGHIYFLVATWRSVAPSQKPVCDFLGLITGSLLTEVIHEAYSSAFSESF